MASVTNQMITADDLSTGGLLPTEYAAEVIPVSYTHLARPKRDGAKAEFLTLMFSDRAEKERKAAGA